MAQEQTSKVLSGAFTEKWKFNDRESNNNSHLNLFTQQYS